MTSGGGVHYKSMFDAGSQIVKKEGTKSLFKGAVGTGALVPLLPSLLLSLLRPEHDGNPSGALVTAIFLVSVSLFLAVMPISDESTKNGTPQPLRRIARDHSKGPYGPRAFGVFPFCFEPVSLLRLASLARSLDALSAFATVVFV